MRQCKGDLEGRGSTYVVVQQLQQAPPSLGPGWGCPSVHNWGHQCSPATYRASSQLRHGNGPTKGVPTLQHMRSKRYSRPDNIFCSSLLSSSVFQCAVNAGACPVMTDHFPIITGEDSAQTCLRFQDGWLGGLPWKLEYSALRPPWSHLTARWSFFSVGSKRPTNWSSTDTIRTRIKLKWPTPHLRQGVANATTWIMQFCRLTRISTGVNAKLLRQLYISVAIPKMTYTLDVQYTPQPNL